MTLINASHADNETDDGTKSQKIRGKTFDARNILDKYAKHDFGSQVVNEIHLAILKTKDDDGFYKCTGSVQF